MSGTIKIVDFDVGSVGEPSIVYSYCVSLSIGHPSADPTVFTRTLGLEPRFAEKVGEPRVRRGNVLPPGDESRWHHDFALANPAIKVEEALLSIADGLGAHRTFFEELASDGGWATLGVGFFMGTRNTGFGVSPPLSRACASLSLALDFDIYESDAPEIEPLQA